MERTRAIVVDPDATGRLVVREVEAPVPAAGEALVRVEATSVNPGEVQLAMTADAGWRPGRDFAGVVLERAADGTGPEAGTRIVGMRNEPGVWAERISAPTTSIADLPDQVGFAQAATLPVAGLTALRALAKAGQLVTKRVLITGSTGGVGQFAHRLATLGGAHVTGSIRRPEDEPMVRTAGAEEVVVGADLSPARRLDPFDLIIDSLGGSSLATALGLLAPDGICVNIGWSAGTTSPIDVMAFNRTGGATLYGLRLDTEMRGRSITRDLAGLAGLVARGRLHTPIAVEASWTRVAEIADDLLNRRFNGKAVLTLE